MKLHEAAAYLPYGLRCEILNYQNDYVGEKGLECVESYSFIAYNAKGERIETNEPIKSIELWKD